MMQENQNDVSSVLNSSVVPKLCDVEPAANQYTWEFSGWMPKLAYEWLKDGDLDQNQRPKSNALLGFLLVLLPVAFLCLSMSSQFDFGLIFTKL